MVAVTGAVDLALNDHAITAVAVVTGDEECQKAGDEEENAVPVRLLVLPFPRSFLKTYMMPNANEALSIAHCRSMFRL